MDDLVQHPYISVKQKDVRTVYENAEKIRSLFGLGISESCTQLQDVSKTGYVLILLETAEGKLLLSELSKIQNYVDSLCSSDHDDRASCGGEDSSYDSDYEPEDSTQQHQDVSRTVSDTLGAEFAEYVSDAARLSCTPAYLAKVEFALKLGYTERLVQTALQKLGPNPGQNELLEELIKLGAQTSRQQDVASETKTEDVPESIPEHLVEDPLGMQLRPIVIDGSNVAMSHGNKEVYSCRGIKICVDWFRARGHREITVFVPKFRKESARLDNPVTGQEILSELEKERILVFTPSRLVGGKRMICYDDRYIIKLAAEIEGIVVSNDNYRDLAHESPDFRKVIEERILMYSFVNDRFMPPDDPLGRSGPTLDNFLRMQPRRSDPPPPCPYAKKCTYGNKCKFSHPERGPLPHKSVTERLVEQAQKNLQARGIHSRDSSPGSHLKGSKSLSLPLSSSFSSDPDSNRQTITGLRKTPLSRTKSSVPGLSPAPDVSSQIKSKSHSVENVTGQMCYPNPCQMSAPPPGYGVWSHLVSPDQQIWPRQHQYSPGPVGSHVAVSKKLSDPESSAAENVNLHQKLQRQLTLNPSCDPRLQRLQQYRSGQHHTPPHQPVMRLGSGGPPPAQGWEQHLHQSVIRIASAPDSYNHWPPTPPPNPARHMHRLSSTSDPQLNLCVAPGEGRHILPEAFEGAAWPPTTSAPPPVVWSPHTPMSPMSHCSQFTEDMRRKLHFHLASIFPEEQVQTVLRMYPDETNPQKICAAILTMFPKH